MATAKKTVPPLKTRTASKRAPRKRSVRPATGKKTRPVKMPGAKTVTVKKPVVPPAKVPMMLFPPLVTEPVTSPDPAVLPAMIEDLMLVVAELALRIGAAPTLFP